MIEINLSDEEFEPFLREYSYADFEGILSGDGNEFCWAVDAETYERITGEKPSEKQESPFHPGMFNLYPNDIFGFSVEKRRFQLKMEPSGKEEKSA